MRITLNLVIAGAFALWVSDSLAAEARDPYLGVQGGALLVWFPEPEFTEIDVATDPLVAATLGFHVARNTSLEVEVGYAWGRNVEFEQQAEGIVTDNWPTGNVLFVNANTNFGFGRGGVAEPFVIGGIGIFNVARVDQNAKFAVNGEVVTRRVQTEATTDIALNFGGGVLLRQPELLGVRLEMRQYIIFSEDDLSFALRLAAGVVFPGP